MKAYATKARELYDAPSGCCLLCGNAFTTDGVLHTSDYTLFVRNKKLAQFTMVEGAILRSLFEAKPAFRLLRETLVERTYPNNSAPLTAMDSMNVHISHMRPKLAELDMGLIANAGYVTLLFSSHRLAVSRGASEGTRARVRAAS